MGPFHFRNQRSTVLFHGMSQSHTAKLENDLIFGWDRKCFGIILKKNVFDILENKSFSLFLIF